MNHDKQKTPKKQISFLIDERLFRDFHSKLKRQSKSLTLFFQNVIKEYLAKKIS